MSGLERFHFHAAERPREELESRPEFRGVRSAAADRVDAGFSSDEGAARHYLGQILDEDERSAMRGIVAPERPEVVPDLRLESVQELPGTGTRLVRFDQTKDSIPVFGGHAVCEVGEDRALVSASGEVAEVSGVSPIATISQAEALKALAGQLGIDAGSIEDTAPPELQFFIDESAGDWHLVWLFHGVAAAPPDFKPRGHGLGRSPRDLHPRFDYLVDAHDGSLVYHYSAVPVVAAPTYGSGVDEHGSQVSFLGQMDGSEFELRDPLRRVATYDLRFGDIGDPSLGDPVRDDDGNLGEEMKGVVSAHANASAVDDFFRGVLKRNGIDDKGMELVSVVNCTYSEHQSPPEWHNAVWWDNRMWYGQASDGDGGLRSFARFRDVAAHELTHGVTEKTADLVYRDQSGALNESYSDILGIMVKNWDFERPEDGGDVSGWDWQLGAGLGRDGRPLRDLSDPARTGDPAHMADYLHTSSDNGGVHTNSNIHNKAAHNVLTATEADGSRTFTPRDCAYMFYVGLTRLGRLSDFHDSMVAVSDAAASLWRADPPTRDRKVAAVRAAFEEVGIE
jgi:Zn-dependent metalloprotease